VRSARRIVQEATRLEIGRVERLGEEIAHLELLGFAFEIGKDYRDVAAKFPDELAAGTARWSEGVGVGDDGDSVEAALALADGFEDGHALSADGEAIGGVLDVAAAEDSARCSAQCGADTEVGVWSVSIFAGLLSDTDKMVVVGHG
jgi:hypothetical protein